MVLCPWLQEHDPFHPLFATWCIVHLVYSNIIVTVHEYCQSLAIIPPEFIPTIHEYSQSLTPCLAQTCNYRTFICCLYCSCLLEPWVNISAKRCWSAWWQAWIRPCTCTGCPPAVVRTETLIKKKLLACTAAETGSCQVLSPCARPIESVGLHGDMDHLFICVFWVPFM